MINKDCPLVLSNLYEYDITACAYNILKSIGWDLSDIDINNKKERNIKIGLLQKDNPRLSEYLHNSISNIIDYYLEINNISNDDVILRQKDGITITKLLPTNDSSIPLDFRGIISKLIFSSDKKSWIVIYSNGDVSIKGVRDKTIDTSYFNLLGNLDYSNKKNLMKGINHIRNNVLSSNNLFWFCRENLENNTYIVPMKNEGDMEIRKSFLHAIDSGDIDKLSTWEKYLWPFVRSLLVQCI